MVKGASVGPGYNPSVNSRTAHSRLALQTLDLDARKTDYRVNWGDSGGTLGNVVARRLAERLNVGISNFCRLRFWLRRVEHHVRTSASIRSLSAESCAGLSQLMDPRLRYQLFTLAPALDDGPRKPVSLQVRMIHYDDLYIGC